jgi:hypothetical protein
MLNILQQLAEEYDPKIGYKKQTFDHIIKSYPVKLDDIKIKFYHLFKNSTYNIDDFENIIYLKYVDLLPEFISLNDSKRLRIKKLHLN